MLNPKRISLMIKSGVRVNGLPAQIKEQIKADLTFKNKAYDDAAKYGRYISQDILPHISYWYEDRASGQFMIPKGYTKNLIRLLKHYDIDYRIRDETYTAKEPLDLVFKGTLRDYQQDACDAMLTYPNGVLEAKTGSGKTTMALYIISKRKQPTLIIVHSKELLKQWKDRIKQFLGVDAGEIGGGKFDVRPVTVGIVNSVRSNIKEIRRSFGFVVVDETHRVPSTIFTDALMFMQSKFTLGLSATPFRNDGLDRAINAFIGPTLHKVPSDVLFETGAVLKPKIYFVKTNFYTPSKDYKRIIADLTKDKARNELIVRLAIQDIKQQNEVMLIAVDRVEMGEIISGMLTRQGFKNHFLHGSLPDDRRKRMVRDVQDGTTKLLIATMSLIGEGFDVDRLNSLILASPIKYSGKVIQIVGRILRPADDKVARLYDFRDDDIQILKRHAMDRVKVYKEQWGNDVIR